MDVNLGYPQPCSFTVRTNLDHDIVFHIELKPHGRSASTRAVRLQQEFGDCMRRKAALRSAYDAADAEGMLSAEAANWYEDLLNEWDDNLHVIGFRICKLKGSDILSLQAKAEAFLEFAEDVADDNNLSNQLAHSLAGAVLAIAHRPKESQISKQEVASGSK